MSDLSPETVAKLDAVRTNLERLSVILRRGSIRMIGLQRVCRECSGTLDEMSDELAQLTHPKILKEEPAHEQHS